MPKPDHRLWLILVCAALGVVLMLFVPSSGVKSAAEPEQDWQTYITALEEKAAALCSRVEGVQEVTVAISLAQGVEYVYTDTDARETLLLTERPPRISGIGVVCTGGEDPVTVEKLVSLLSAAFGVGANRIYIAAGQ